MIKTVISISALLVFLATNVDCWAFRCGSGVVSTGDSKAKVLFECGKPTSKEKAGTKKKAGQHRKTERTRDKERTASHTTVHAKTKPIEKWYYNCGDNDFIYVLTFEGGTLKSEETEGYGKGISHCRGR